MTTGPERETLTPELAHERERHDLLAQAARAHLNNMQVEMRRYEEDIRRIEGVYDLRTGRA